MPANPDALCRRHGTGRPICKQGSVLAPCIFGPSCFPYPADDPGAETPGHRQAAWPSIRQTGSNETYDFLPEAANQAVFLVDFPFGFEPDGASEAFIQIIDRPFNGASAQIPMHETSRTAVVLACIRLERFDATCR